MSVKVLVLSMYAEERTHFFGVPISPSNVSFCSPSLRSVEEVRGGDRRKRLQLFHSIAQTCSPSLYMGRGSILLEPCADSGGRIGAQKVARPFLHRAWQDCEQPFNRAAADQEQG